MVSLYSWDLQSEIWISYAHADHTECDAMKSCTYAKCEQECQDKSTNLPIEPECAPHLTSVAAHFIGRKPKMDADG